MNIPIERIITSIVLIILLVIIGIINNTYLTLSIVAVITITAMYEAQKLFFAKNEKIFYFLSVLSIFSVFTNPLFIGTVGILSVAGYIAFYKKNINEISVAIYPFLPLILLEMLYLKGSMSILIWLVVIISLSDSSAYIIGKNFGKKFINSGFSASSPNKTWEGVIGGIVTGSIIGSFVGLMFYNFLTAFIISLLVSVAGIFGDLFESFLKRRAGVKDSGKILPGHGGILDRIDGYLFGAPLMLALVLAMAN